MVVWVGACKEERGGETCKRSWREMSWRSFSLTRRLKMRLSLSLWITITPKTAAPNARININPYDLPLPLPPPPVFPFIPTAIFSLCFSLSSPKGEMGVFLLEGFISQWPSWTTPFSIPSCSSGVNKDERGRESMGCVPNPWFWLTFSQEFWAFPCSSSYFTSIPIFHFFLLEIGVGLAANPNLIFN